MSSLKRDDVSSEPSYLSASKAVAVIDVWKIYIRRVIDVKEPSKRISQKSILLDVFEALISHIE